MKMRSSSTSSLLMAILLGALFPSLLGYKGVGRAVD
ncbi:hypothetical protein LINPERPRIM_LOCUS34277 [Linum perenne]